MKKISISVLTRGYDNLFNYNPLIDRNNLIFEHIIEPSKLSFDVHIFHEGNISEEHQLYIKNLSKPKLIFKNVKELSENFAFDDSKNIMNFELCPPNTQSSSFPLGYKHMCHFWSIDFFNYLNGYDYLIRIDEDCFIKKFDFIILNRLLNGEIRFTSPFFQGQDEHYVIVGLEKLWNQFIIDNEITSKKNFGEIKCPYTNFMMLDLNYFRNNQMVQNFLKCVDESNGIYSNRWGDLPIWGVILSTLIDENLYKESKSIKYYHSSHNKEIN
jgi:hypothetical protein